MYLSRRLSLAAAIVVLGLGSAAASKNHDVQQSDKSFSTEAITVAVGDSVTFHNGDKVKHNIIIKDLGFNSGMQEPGVSATAGVDKSGDFEVRCGIHPKMKMTIVAK